MRELVEDYPWIIIKSYSTTLFNAHKTQNFSKTKKNSVKEEKGHVFIKEMDAATNIYSGLCLFVLLCVAWFPD